MYLYLRFLTVLLSEEKEESNDDDNDDTWYNDTPTFSGKINSFRGKKRKGKTTYRNTNKKFKRTSGYIFIYFV